MAMSTPKVYNPLPTPSGATPAALSGLDANSRTPSPAVRKTSTPLRARERIASDMDASQLERASRETLIEIVLRNTEIKEELNLKLGRLEDEQESTAMEMRDLRRAEEAARVRAQQFLADQSRMEEELSGRIEVLEKLRSTIRDSDRDKREAEKRYREQTESFDSERQSWYDQEQHFKLRISNLSSAPRKARLSDISTKSERAESVEPITPTPPPRQLRSVSSTSSLTDPSRSSSPSIGPTRAELELQDQLASLTTAYDSLSNTSRALQTELGELKRVYQDVQEENESYELILGERTMNGQLRESALLRRSWTETDESDGPGFDGFGQARNGLESVGETEEEESDAEEDMDTTLSNLSVKPVSNRARKNGSPRKRSGGLDLEAELEKAQMADGEGTIGDGKKKPKHRKSLSALEVDNLKGELKSLREANKALTLYVSKIVDRVCSQEGFEKVLAVDFKLTPKPVGYSPEPADARLFKDHPDALPTPTTGNATGTTRSSKGGSAPPGSATIKTDPELPSPPSAGPPSAAANRQQRAARRPLSLDWGSVSSAFASALTRTSSAAPTTPPISAPLSRGPTSGSNTSNPNLKPMLLDPSASTATVRRLSTDEDEDDLKERERLKAELALLGFNEPANRPPPTTKKLGNNLSPGQTGPTHTKRRSIGYGGSSQGLPSTIAFPTPTPPAISPALPEPRDLDAHFATRTLGSEEEVVAKEELKSGRASGFTEIQFRRNRPGSMSMNRRTVSGSSGNGEEGRAGERGGSGLGLSGVNAGSEALGPAIVLPGKTIASHSPESSPDISMAGSIGGYGVLPADPPGAVVAEEGGWGRRMKRMSMGNWSSPPPPAS